MPTLDELTTSVYRDLADEAQVVFTPLQVQDFIRSGIAELNALTGLEKAEDIAFVPNTYTYQTTIDLPYVVELRDMNGGILRQLIEPEPNSEAYGEFRFMTTPTGGVIEVGRSLVDNLDWEDDGTGTGAVETTTFLHLVGYGVRDMPDAVGDETGLNNEEQFSVRDYAKAQGFDLLAHDRSLFAQWQGQTNNTDVSPTQMMQMAASASSDWQRRRGLLRVVRRYW